MDNNVKKYLFDLKESIESIESYLGDKRAAIFILFSHTYFVFMTPF